jgi:predicted esterase
MEQINLLQRGAALGEAQAALVLVHGRGATAESILPLADELAAIASEGGGFTLPLAVLAPQAPENTWYPYPFTAPFEFNEPHLSNALQTLAEVFARLKQAEIQPERVLLAGFSQGACLASEYAARNARRYGGLAIFSGGLIGPPSAPRNYPGSLDGTPVFLGCSDRDPHIPEARVRESALVLENLGGEVTLRLYPNMAHTINEDELEFAANMLANL